MHLRRVVTRFCTIKKALTDKIAQELSPLRFEIEDESRYHSRGSETHFKMLIVSEKFRGLGPVQKQRLVYQSLGDQMGRIHALTLTCRTPEEAQSSLEANESPGCVHPKDKPK